MWKESLVFVWLLALSVWDIREKRVPVWLLWIGGMVATGSLLCRQLQGGMDWLRAGRALMPGILLLLLALGTGKAGSADGVILMVLGILEGFESCLTICFGSLALSAVISGVLLAIKKVRRSTKIPFIPFMAAGWLLAVTGRCGIL